MPAFKRTAAALSAVAILSMSASPAFARGWGGWGGHRHHHRGGIDAGDVIAGVLILGGIAAVASAASKSDKQRRERLPEPPPPDARYDGREGDQRWNDSRGYQGGLNGAVDRCVGEVERGDTRVDTVDSAVRDGDGWRVEGQTDGGDFSCSIDRDGRVRNLRVDGRTAAVSDDFDGLEEAEPAELGA